jgi:hypothetical protein
MAEYGRRGVTFHACNVGLPDDGIDSNQLRRETEWNVDERVHWFLSTEASRYLGKYYASFKTFRMGVTVGV